jgi:hypothetical protein
VQERAQQKLVYLVASSIVAILSGNVDQAPGFAQVAAAQLDADLWARIAEVR